MTPCLCRSWYSDSYYTPQERRKESGIRYLFLDGLWGLELRCSGPLVLALRLRVLGCLAVLGLKLKTCESMQGLVSCMLVALSVRGLVFSILRFSVAF